MTVYLGNDTNLVREASLTATNIVASRALERTDTAPKQGRGVVALAGAYTGSSDRTVDVEILDTEGDLARVSQPIFTGAGNGTITDVTASDALPAQHVVAQLEDLGSTSADAIAQFQGQQLDAKEVGDAGNEITIIVDRENITRAPTPYSVPAGGISAGTNEYSGDQWNFGAVTITDQFAQGPGAPEIQRISFGDDPMVYRPYRRFVGSGYVYGFSPAPVRDIPAGAKVWSVSGAYQLLISDGDTNETLTDIVTLYDALRKINSDSTLVKCNDDPDLGPVVVVANDLTPGGKGVVDVSVWTNAYITEIVRDGSQQMLDAQFVINASDDAPTETLTLTAQTGARFRVEGSVSGRLTDATAGEPYSDGPYAFTIPDAVADPSADPDATIAVMYKASAEHQDGPFPNISFPGALLGPNARAGTYTFTYRNAPPEPCDEEGTISGGIDYACLGLTGSGGGTIVADKAEIVVRIQKVLDSLQARIDANTEAPATVDEGPVVWNKTTYGLFIDALTKMDSSEAKLETELGQYAAGAYTKGTVIYDPTDGARWIVVVPGTATGTPDFSVTAVGTTATAGPVIFQSLGKGPLAQFDAAFAAMEGEADAMDGIDSPQNLSAWSPGTVYQVGSKIVPTQQRDFYLEHTGIYNDAGTLIESPPIATGAKEPTWDAPGEGEGGTGITEEYIDTDKHIRWLAVAYDEDTVQLGVRDAFYDRYRSKLNSALYAAGVGANFDLAGPKGDGCWPGDDHKGEPRWESQDGFLAFFNGIYNTTSRETTDADGNPVRNATREFGFYIKCGCEENLREGDQIEVVIQGGFTEGNGGGYSPGDNVQATVIHGEPIAFSGGQTGTDALTWSVTAGGVAKLPYLLSTTSPAPYDSGDGIGFMINQGSIPFALGDRFEFDIETGQFRYRVDGGAWEPAADIEDTDIGAGLTIAFTGGAAPSWVGGDAWSFIARAINGPEALRQPTDARCSWTGSTLITIVPGLDNGPVKGIAIADHDIPSDATITLTGGALGFAVPTVTRSIPWRARNIWVAFGPNTCAEWRIAINKGGSANCVYLGPGFTPLLPNGIPEHGVTTKLVQLGSFLKRRAIGATIEHTAIAQSSIESMLDMLEHACTFDDRRLIYVPNAAQPECGIVSFDPDSLAIDDELAFQPVDINASLQRVTLTLTPVA